MCDLFSGHVEAAPNLPKLHPGSHSSLPSKCFFWGNRKPRGLNPAFSSATTPFAIPRLLLIFEMRAVSQGLLPCHNQELSKGRNSYQSLNSQCLKQCLAYSRHSINVKGMTEFPSSYNVTWFCKVITECIELILTRAAGNAGCELSYFSLPTVETSSWTFPLEHNMCKRTWSTKFASSPAVLEMVWMKKKLKILIWSVSDLLVLLL